MHKLKTTIKLVAFANRLNLTGSFFLQNVGGGLSGFGVFFVLVVFLGLGICCLVGFFGVCEMEPVFHEGLVYEIMPSNTKSNFLINVNAIK